MALIDISPSQALILLIEACKKKSPSQVNAEHLSKLKSFYLNGVLNPGEHAELRQIFATAKAGILSQYNILDNPEIITNDPTRRYFESHLSILALKYDLFKINKNHLKIYEKNLKLHLNFYDESRFNLISKVIDGEYKELLDYLKSKGSDGESSAEEDSFVLMLKEYSQFIQRVESRKMFTDTQGFDDKHREIIALFVRVSILAVSCCQSQIAELQDPLPLNIYKSGIFQDKGKKLKEFAQTARNQHYGLMKGHMPISRDDVLMADEVIPHLKPSDQSSYILDSKWCRLNFYRLVHPFSNSITGTILCQLRALAHFDKNGVGVFIDDHDTFVTFFRLIISTLLSYGGGHSLFEFIAPLMLPQVSEQFDKTTIEFDNINIESMFTLNSPNIIDDALDMAINYNNAYLLKKKLNQEIMTTEIKLKPASEKSARKVGKKINNIRGDKRKREDSGYCNQKDSSKPKLSTLTSDNDENQIESKRKKFKKRNKVTSTNNDEKNKNIHKAFKL